MAYYKEFAIILSAVYACLLLSYFFIEVRPLKKARIIVKSLLVFLYLTFAAVNTIFYFKGYLQILVLCALVFNAAGDILLVTSRKNMVRGAAIFLVGSLFLSAVMIILLITNRISFSRAWWALIFGVVMLTLTFILQYKGILDLGKIAFITSVYLIGVTLMGTLALMCLITLNGGALTLAAGSLLFTLSDYLLILYIFKSKKSPLLVSNSASYFSGMWLISLSLARFL